MSLRSLFGAALTYSVPPGAHMSLRAALLAVIAIPLLPSVARSEPTLADQGYGFLKKYCFECHGGEREEVPGYFVLDRDVLIRDRGGLKNPYVKLGKPKESLLWERIADGSMPMENPDGTNPKPTDEETKLLEKWIVEGAPFPETADRDAVAGGEILKAIDEDLTSLSKQVGGRPHLRRYLTFGNLIANRQILPQTIRLHQAAVSKLLNSLSWEAMAVPPFLDPKTQEVMVIDLDRYGWTASAWEALLAVYPYGLSYANDPVLVRVENSVRAHARTRLPYLRADWFVATASRPPLYDRLLKLPATLAELERERLRIDFEENFRLDRLVRAGMITSGVSRHNRMVERHPTPFGAYWRSYDFQSSQDRGNIVLFPLGPNFVGNPYPTRAFEHAGGELIFNLPNGLQGYMLADAKDRRLDAAAPVAIVRDLRERAGTPEVVNGLSCIGCHARGMRNFNDQILGNSGTFTGDELAKVQLLFKPQEQMDRLLRQDEERFMRAAEEATGVYLMVGDDAKAKIRDFPEPIEEVARLYFKDLKPAQVSAEIGVSPDVLQGAIGGNRKLRSLGLEPLLRAGALKRELWERKHGLFSRAAFEFGFPFVP